MNTNNLYVQILVDRSLSNYKYKTQIAQFLTEIEGYLSSIPQIRWSLSYFNDHILEIKKFNQKYPEIDYEEVPFIGRTALYTALTKATGQIRNLGNVLLVVITDGEKPNLDINSKKKCFKIMKKLDSVAVLTEEVNENKGLYNLEIPFSESSRLFDHIDLYTSKLNQIEEIEPHFDEMNSDIMVGNQSLDFEASIDSNEVQDIEPEIVVDLKEDVKVDIEIQVIEYLLGRRGGLYDNPSI